MRRIAIGVTVLVLMGWAASEHAVRSGAVAPEFLYTVAKEYQPLAWMQGRDRFPAGAAVFVQEAAGRRTLVSGFAASADPAVSFDGRSALFAGKRSAQDHWQIWEIRLAGGEPRPVTNCADDCVRPFYLPDDRVVYARKVAGRFVIHTGDLLGGNVVTLTYGAASSLPTDVLRDGRILFESELATTGGSEIYAVYSDGSGVESYRCDHGKARHSGRQVISGDIVFVNEKRTLGRFTSVHAKEVSVAAPAGEYAGDVAEKSDSEWLIAWRARTHEKFRLVWWRLGQPSTRPAVEELGRNVLQPVLIREWDVPKKHPSGLHDWQIGNLLCLNPYTSKTNFAPGSIRSVRLYTQDAEGRAQVLGMAPVEKDGSFYLQVPGDRPLQMELLDAAGKTLKREAGWFWMRKGEQRVCVGCHAGPETAPENAVPMVLLKSTTPAEMTGGITKSAAGGHE